MPNIASRPRCLSSRIMAWIFVPAVAITMGLAGCMGSAPSTPPSESKPAPSPTGDAPYVVAYGSEAFVNEVYSWENIVDISAGHGVAFGKTSDGTFLLASDSPTGGMGEALSALRGVKSVDGSTDRIVVLMDDGTVRSIKNLAGSIDADEGDGDDATPPDMAGWRDIKEISADEYVVGLQDDGTVLVSWGDAGDNEAEKAAPLPDLRGWDDITHVSTEYDIIAGIRKNGDVIAVRTRPDEPMERHVVKSLKGATAIDVTSDGHIIGILPDGSLGNARFDEDEVILTVNVDGYKNVASISGEGSHFVATMKDGHVHDAIQAFDAGNCTSGWNGFRKACIVRTREVIGLCDTMEDAKTARNATQDPMPLGGILY